MSALKCVTQISAGWSEYTWGLDNEIQLIHLDNPISSEIKNVNRTFDVSYSFDVSYLHLGARSPGRLFDGEWQSYHWGAFGERIFEHFLVRFSNPLTEYGATENLVPQGKADLVYGFTPFAFEVLYGTDWDDWSSQDYTGYEIDLRVYNHISLSAPSFIALDPSANEEILSNDILIGNGYANMIFGAYGDDTLKGKSGNDTLVGGSGDDVVVGGKGDDDLFGDWANVPDYGEESGDLYVLEFPEEDLTVSGNDNLQGGNGSDNLYGGPGDDELYGGPRGDGYTDILYGGDGADIFYLSYGEDGGSGSEWWDGYAESYAAGVGKDVVKSVVTALAKEAAAEAFKQLGPSILLGGASGAIGAGAQLGIKALFAITEKAPTPATGEDVMVVTDFDPREDVLALPLEDGTSLFPSASYAASSAAPELGKGWLITFSKLDGTIFAEVFLAEDFYEEFDLTANDPAAEAFLTNIFTSSVTFNGSGIEDYDDVYPFPDDPSYYTGGQVPSAVTDTMELDAPEGTRTEIYGAFGPNVVFQPAVSTGIVYVSGTVSGDFLSVNKQGLAPSEYVTGQFNILPSFVKGFGGDDIILGGNGQDMLYGGEGDDRIYTFSTQVAGFGLQQETVEGGNGDDTVFTGETRAILDGGEGNDTLTYEISYVGIDIDLAAGTGKDVGTNTVTGQSANVTAIYTVSGFENVTGSSQDDIIVGDENDNIIQGLDGTDYLDGGDGIDTVSCQDHSGRVVVDLISQTVEEYAADSDVLLAEDTAVNFECATGSAYDDTLTGTDTANRLTGGDGCDSIVAGAGDDTIISGTDYGAVGTPTYGTDDNDTVYGGAGSDYIDGGDDQDKLYGGEGDDTVIGGTGLDEIYGDSGSDILVPVSFDTAATGDTLADFEYGVDLIGLVYNDDFAVTYDMLTFLASSIYVTYRRNGLETFKLAELPGFNTAQLTPDDFVAVYYEVDPTAESSETSTLEDALIGTAGSDQPTGNNQDNGIYGLAGDDTIAGGNGNDTIEGGETILFEDEGLATLVGVDTANLADSDFVLL